MRFPAWTLLLGASLAAAPALAQRTDSTLTIGQKDVAAVTEKLNAPPATRIYRSVLPDGQVVISDRPVPKAKSVETRSYELPPAAQAQSRARAEREYWRRQAEAFDRRHRERLDRWREEESSRTQIAVLVDPYADRPVVWGAPPPFVVPPSAVPPVYRSSPGAVMGRSDGFIGSGFSRAR